MAIGNMLHYIMRAQWLRSAAVLSARMATDSEFRQVESLSVYSAPLCVWKQVAHVRQAVAVYVAGVTAIIEECVFNCSACAANHSACRDSGSFCSRMAANVGQAQAVQSNSMGFLC
jgi:hypothetical protein